MLHFSPGVLSPGLQSLGALPSPSIDPPKTVKYRRFDDPGLQRAYAYLVTAFSEKTVPLYGRIFSDDEADTIARQIMEAARAGVSSPELQQRAVAAIEPPVTAAVRNAVGTMFLGALTVGLIGVAAYGFKVAR